MAVPLSSYVREGMKESSRIFYSGASRLNTSFLFHIPYCPTTLVFNITDNCNSRCITCRQWQHASVGELDTEEVGEVLAQARDLGIRNIEFAGGEPLLRRDLPAVIKIADDLGFADLSITTNGLLLTEEKAVSLIESGLDGFSVSIDGTAAVHDSVRGVNGGFDRSTGALKTLIGLRDSRYPDLAITIGTTVMKPTFPEILNMVNLARDLRITCGFNLLNSSLYFFRDIDTSDLWIPAEDRDRLDDLVADLHQIKAMHPGLISKSYSSLEYMKEYFQDPKREDIPCHLGYEKVYVGPHGEVYSGCWALPPMGTVRETPLTEIVATDAYRQRLKDMFLKKCPGCSCNYSTNLLYHIPSLCHELKWRVKGRLARRN
ncbi:radical SAM protein [uncultured Methanofollis sp.]|uniref:radical SAM protein n=1 Tax=uncultured Methanofollis sp. TaxID=262500 RepID=UPI002628BD21|nr:radical SAM protein [uncultured Methanofollis sp.]